MEYTDFEFSTIKYKNGENKDPQVTLKYSAKSLDDGAVKKAKDKWERLPQREFRRIWSQLVEYWKINLQEILGEIDWDYKNIRINQVKIKWSNGDPVAIKYRAKVHAPFDEVETIPTPYVQPSVVEGEIQDIQNLCDAAEAYIHGASDQSELNFEGDNEDDEEDEEIDELEGEFPNPFED